MLVEDDEDYRHVLMRIIDRMTRDRGWEVLALARLQDGERALEHTSVDLLLADYNLPDGLGTALTRKAPSNPGRVQRVILTGDPERVERAWRDEPQIADEIWSKNWEVGNIADRIDAAMARIEFCRYWT